MEKENQRPVAEKRRSLDELPLSKRKHVRNSQTPSKARPCVPLLDKSLFDEYGVTVPSERKDADELDSWNDRVKPVSIPDKSASAPVSPIKGFYPIDSSTPTKRDNVLQVQSEANVQTIKEFENATDLSDRRPVGLANIGNSCFINAVVRALLSLKWVRDEIMQLPPCNDEDEQSLEQNLCRVYEYIEHKCSKEFSVRQAIRGIWKSSSLEQFRQHDAHEFLLAIFDKLPFADRFFGIPLQIQVQCTKCKQMRVRYDRTLDLSASPSSRKDQAAKLSDCLRRSFGPELVTDLPCEGCKNCEALVHRRIMALPLLLVLCLMRFDYRPKDESTDGCTAVKLNDSVSIPAEINLEQLCIRPAMPAKYELRAIVSHYGYSVEYGHYVCDALSRSPDGTMEQWFSFNDRDVEPKDLSGILQQRERTAYLLFYQRI